MNADKKSEKNIAGMISINLPKDSKATSNIINNLDKENILVLPTRNLVLFPGIALPIQLGRENSVRVAEYAKNHDLPIAVVCQINPDIDEPALTDLYQYGTLARIIDIIELPDGIKTVIVEGLAKIRVEGQSTNVVEVKSIAVKGVMLEEKKDIDTPEFRATYDKIRETTRELVQNTMDDMTKMHFPQIDRIKDPYDLINNVTVHIPLDVDEKQRILEQSSLSARAELLLASLLQRKEKMEIMRDIMEKTRVRMDEGQRNAFLQQQIDVLRTELEGDDADDIQELEARAEAVGFPDEIKERFEKELRKIKRYNPQSPDYAVQYTYLDTLLSLPWQDYTMPSESFKDAERVLERDHYGIKKVKERILEQIALILNNPEGQSPIICFVGPPGVGKTSLGQSIAEALGREFQRVSLGGLHDEAEIRGHRRTYIGAMPGRIIEAMRRATTVNPVIMLDELDKIGKDFKGDPAAALLEVLDPAQNCKFHDNYIDVDYDLSSVLFIATANTLSTISKPLLDRIEVIELSGYTVEEKVEIAIRHLIPRLRIKNAIEDNVFKISKAVIKRLIENYTSESGVRQLEKRIEQLMRKKLLEYMRAPGKHIAEVMIPDLQHLLGAPVYIKDKYEGNKQPGVVTGLAWTSVGGEILLVEAALSAGKGNLVLTGNLGDVMKESATLALEWLRVNAQNYGIDAEIFKNNDFHLHFPEGAIPKDGPSAGITIVTALMSAITKRKLNPYIAMTGEITLRGKVLPVGGIKEKILAAKRAGIKNIILSAENKKDIEDIEKNYLRGLTFHYVTSVSEVLERALQSAK